LLAVIAVYGWALRLALPVPAARALAVTTLVAANLAMILAARGAALSLAQKLRAPNPALRWVLVGASALLLFALATPPVARVFRFEWPGTLPLVAAALVGVGAVMLAAHRPERD